MCGRYTLIDSKKLAQRFAVDINETKNLHDSYNIAPGQMLPVVKRKNNKTYLRLMHWGLIPVWSKDGKTGGYSLINAKAETLAEKPMWKRLIGKMRCVVPASGFYEWKRSGKEKIPYYIHLQNEPIFGFAGLYDIWVDNKDKKHYSFTIITTAPNKLMSPIHDRMPAILDRSDEAKWLDNGNTHEIGFLESLLHPYREVDMKAYAVATTVNSPVHNQPSLLNKINT